MRLMCVFVCSSWGWVIVICVFILASRPDLPVVYVCSRGPIPHRVCASGMRRVRILHLHVGEPKHSIV